MLSYFPHDFNARGDPKLSSLLMQMGYEGIGIYWSFIEYLYEQNGYVYEKNLASVAFALKVELEKLQKMLQIAEFKVQAGKIYSDAVLRRLHDIRDKSKQAKKSVEARWEKQEEFEYATAIQSDITIETKEDKQIQELRKRREIQVLAVLSYFNETCDKKLTLNTERRKIILSCLEKNRTFDDIKRAIKAFSQDDWSDRAKFCDLIYAIGIRNKIDNFEKWFNTPLKKDAW